MNIPNFINEHNGTFNTLYFQCNLDLHIKVPLILTTNITSISKKKFISTLFSITHFLLIGNETEYNVLDLYGIHSANSDLVTTHIFTINNSTALSKLNLLPDNSSSIFILHTIADRILVQSANQFEILSSKIRFGFLTGRYKYISITSIPNYTLKQNIERTLNITRNGKYFNFNPISNITHSIHTSIITSMLGVPQQLGFSNFSTYIDEIFQLLSVSMLDVYIHPKGKYYLYKKYVNSTTRIKEAEEFQKEIHNLKRIYGQIHENELYVIRTGSEFMNFATCDGVERSIDFTFYTTTYDVYSWVTFLAFALLIIPFLLLTFEYANHPSLVDKLKYIFNIIFFNMATILEVSYDSGSSSFSATRFMFCLWSLLTLVLVNAFKGIVVSELTAPVLPIQKWKSVSETDGFLFVASYSFDYLSNQEFAQYFETGSSHTYEKIYGIWAYECFPKDLDFVMTLCFNSGVQLETKENHTIKIAPWRDALSKVRSKYCQHSHLLSLLLKIFYNDKENFSNAFKQAEGIMVALIETCYYAHIIKIQNTNITKTYFAAQFSNALIIHPPPSAEYVPLKSVLLQNHEMLSSCNHNGYVDDEKVLDAFLSLSGKRGIPAYKKGEDRMFESLTGYQAKRNARIAKELYIGMQKLLAFGIFHIWDEWMRLVNPTLEYMIEHEESKVEKVPAKPLGLNSNIYTAFLLYVFGVSGCFAMYLLEISRILRLFNL